MISVRARGGRESRERLGQIHGYRYMEIELRASLQNELPRTLVSFDDKLYATVRRSAIIHLAGETRTTRFQTSFALTSDTYIHMSVRV